MKILRFEGTNFMRLQVVEITPAGNVITLAGKNAQGKSSIMHGIAAALGGGKAVPGVPIHEGQDTATVRLDLGETGGPVDLKIERRFWGDDKTDVIITQASGARVQKPQQMLDGLINRISFDPLNGFMRLKPEDQLEMLRKLVKLDVDIDALAGHNAVDYEKRTEVNREVKSLQARADAIVVPADCPTERRDPAEIADRLQEAMVHNAGIPAKEARRAEAQALIDSAPARIEATSAAMRQIIQNIDAEIAALHSRRAEVKQQEIDEKVAIELQVASLTEKLAAAGPLPEPMNVVEIRAELNSAEDHNVLVTRHQEKSRVEAHAAMKKVESDRLTAAIAERDQQREDAMKNADFPIDGLAFGDNMVMFQGLPLQQASTAEQIRIAMAIATDLNPKLRIVCIREASFLDEEGLKIVAEMAAASDMQVWLEDNRSTDPAAIVIEDGMVKGAAPPVDNGPVGHERQGTLAERPDSPQKVSVDPVIVEPAKPKPERQAPTKLL